MLHGLIGWVVGCLSNWYCSSVQYYKVREAVFRCYCYIFPNSLIEHTVQIISIIATYESKLIFYNTVLLLVAIVNEGIWRRINNKTTSARVHEKKIFNNKLLLHTLKSYIHVCKHRSQQQERPAQSKTDKTGANCSNSTIDC